MEFRPADTRDLPRVQAMFRGVVKRMDENGVAIWDECYPNDWFAADIENGRLYLLCDGEELAAAFALCPASAGEDVVQWRESRAKALYVNRLGVNVRRLQEGIGSLMMQKAAETARAAGAEYLRLFVVDVNGPAIRFYEKNGFARVTGVYEDVFVNGNFLREYGYEMEL